MKIETNVANIRKTIKSIDKSRTSLVEKVQAAALAVINHAHMHGDVTLAEELCAAVGNGMKSTALKLWLMDYGPLGQSTKEDRVFSYQRDKSLRDKPEELALTLQAAAAKPWYDYKTEKEVAEFYDVTAALRKIVKKINDGGTKVRDEDADLVAKLRKALSEAENSVDPGF